MPLCVWSVFFSHHASVTTRSVSASSALFLILVQSAVLFLEADASQQSGPHYYRQTDGQPPMSI